MKMFAYHGSAPNFGDDLNGWLWSRLLPGFFDNDPSRLFLGIGSILYDNHPADVEKVVFGAGFAGYSAKPVIDDRWRFYFVRGKKTAEALGLPASLAIGDSGILIRAIDLPPRAKIHKASFMPHFESATYGNWQAVCAELGINFIDPRGDVDTVLDHILSSELVISEAMHGVIISDALRVPWLAIEPHDPNHRAKWSDWASALGVDIRFQALGPSNAIEWLMSRFWSHRRMVYRLRKRRNLLFSLGLGRPLPGAVKALRTVGSAGQLSPDAAIEAVTQAMLLQLDQLKRDYPRSQAAA